MVIELVDGPLKGTLHELAHGFGVPDALGLMDETNPQLQHWYKVGPSKRTARFLRTEELPVPPEDDEDDCDDDEAETSPHDPPTGV